MWLTSPARTARQHVEVKPQQDAGAALTLSCWRLRSSADHPAVPHSVTYTSAPAARTVRAQLFVGHSRVLETERCYRRALTSVHLPSPLESWQDTRRAFNSPAVAHKLIRCTDRDRLQPRAAAVTEVCLLPAARIARIETAI